MTILDPKLFHQESIAQYRRQFQQGRPFRHLCIDGFLDQEVAEALRNHFPPVSNMRKKYNGINEKKAEDASFDRLHPFFMQLKQALAHPDMLRWVSEVTGIPDAFTVNDHRGAGLHQGENGSFLDIHIDFNVHPLLNVHRRLNLILFLERNWQPAWGGELEFWDEKVKRCEAAYLPVFNRCVLFETNEISYHGYAAIRVPEGITRKSYYNYYYTRVAEGVKYHDTIFRTRPSEGYVKKVMTVTKDLVKNVAKRTFRVTGVDTWFRKFE